MNRANLFLSPIQAPCKGCQNRSLECRKRCEAWGEYTIKKEREEEQRHALFLRGF